MEAPSKFEILPGLPATGPMYIALSADNEQFYSEGFVVRFLKSDGTIWIANFKPGWSDFSFAKEYPNANRIVIVAKGQGYIINPEIQSPIETFGLGIRQIIETKHNQLICASDCYLYLIDENESVWQSERISWDGIKDLSVEQNIITGLAYYPMTDSWLPFTFDIESKLITGGSFDSKPTC